MSLPRSVAEILREHVTLEVEGIDRMYLNAYVPGLQYESGVAAFFRRHRGHPFASSVLMDPISKAFVAAIHAFAHAHEVPLLTFEKGQRKDAVMAERLKRFAAPEGVVFVGRAQEKTPVVRTEKRRNPTTGQAYPWLVRSTAMVNHFYFYAVDEDFGPFFLKFGTYFPYNAKLCLNGHEYVKRQLTQRGIPYEALDNGILSCADPRRLQALCDGLSAAKIEAFAHKWLRRLPHPFTPADQRAGYRYQLSILQAEFSLTQVLDRPVTGRVFFEEVIRENLDVGRPDQVQLIFDRRVTRQTPGRFRTRVLTDGVKAKKILCTYFGDIGGLYPQILDLPFDVIGLDFVAGYRNWDVVAAAPFTRELQAGVLDARNTRVESVDELVRAVRRLTAFVSPGRLMISPSAGLEFLPRSVARRKLAALVEGTKVANQDLKGART